MKPLARLNHAFTILAIFIVLANVFAKAQTVTTVYAFTGQIWPTYLQSALVQGNDGNFYGTAYSAINQHDGSVLKITPSGTASILYPFGAKPNDGSGPLAAMVQGSDGNFYGTTARGGSNGGGTVFKITPSGTESVLYSFGSNPNDGSSPQAALLQGSDGNFYGTTTGGGSQGGGTVFGVSLAGTETVLYSFGANPNDGFDPQGALALGSDGNFYGTTQYGGSQGGGTVFEVTLSGTETVLYSFGTDPNDGFNPVAGLALGSDGNFYGTTSNGGSQGGGTVFGVTLSGAETVLYSFGTDPNDGLNSFAGLILGSDGKFYGTTSNGGNQGGGTVFGITLSGTETVLYSFGTNPNDGFDSQAGLALGADGNFYGTTMEGGGIGYGTIFEITPSGTETLLYSAGIATDGANPQGALVQGNDGSFYGTTNQGGATLQGAVFKITPSGAETLVYSFGTNPDDGGNPDLQAGLALGNDGNFYGTTPNGGSQEGGTVFVVTPLGTETVLYTFGVNPNDGETPQAALVKGNDGNFYGTTSFGGSQGYGTVFEITPSGAETVLHSFGTSMSLNDGAYPQGGALILGGDGNFYGTTYSGVNQYSGTVFEITPSGSETPIYVFGTNPNDGDGPITGLALGADGNFYGTTLYGGSCPDPGDGTVFMVTPSGTETVLHSFSFPTSQYNGYVDRPNGLVQGNDGNFYGTTQYGGLYNKGTLFEITPSGTETLLYSFGTNPSDGANPHAAMALGADGNLYGTTEFGGSVQGGTVFKVTLVAAPQLAVEATPSGPYTQGDAADTLTFEVSNTGSVPTVGTVTITDNLPVGLTFSGSNSETINGWAVNVFGQTLTATRADALSAGGAYPILSVTVSVGDDAPASLTNTVSVSGGGAVFGERNSNSIFIARSAMNTWRQTYFPGSTSTGGAGADDATPQNDGVSNLLKFATGMNPLVPGTMPGVAGISNGEISFTYTPSSAAVASGFSFLVEYNDALGGDAWASDAVDQGAVGSGGAPVTATLPANPAGQRFVHLKVTKP